MEYWNFFSGNLDFHEALSSVDDHPDQCFPSAPGLWPRGAGTSSQSTGGSTASAEVCLPITDIQMGDTPLGSPGIWCWVPQVPQRHFYSWMDAKFLLLCWGRMRDILCYHSADITLPLNLPSLGSLFLYTASSYGSSVISFHPAGLP